jgi:ankyrin repeat protein
VSILTSLNKKSSLVLLGCDDIVNLEDHLNNLRGKLKLVLLGQDGLKNSLFVHVGGTLKVGINTNKRIGFTDLFLTQVRNVLNCLVTGVLSQGERDFLKRVGKSAHCVLLNTLNLISLFGNSNGAGELSSTTATNDVVVFNHISYDAESIEQASLSLVTDRP